MQIGFENLKVGKMSSEVRSRGATISVSAPASFPNSPFQVSLEKRPGTAPGSRSDDSCDDTVENEVDEPAKNENVPIKGNSAPVDRDLSEFYHNNLSHIRIRMDNIPPGKSWRQVRYYIGRFINPKCISHINIFSTMANYPQPFKPIQSCMIFLESTISDSDIQKLLEGINELGWEGFNINVEVIPNDTFVPHMEPFAMATSVSGPAAIPRHMAMTAPFQGIAPTPLIRSGSTNTMKGVNNGSLRRDGQAQTPQNNQGISLTGSHLPYMMVPSPMFPPMGMGPYGIPPPFLSSMSPQNGAPRYNNGTEHFRSTQHSFLPRYPQPPLPENRMHHQPNWRRATNNSRNTNSYASQSYIDGVSYPLNGMSIIQLAPNTLEEIAFRTHNKKGNPKQDKTGIFLFNEENFRRQMNERHMFQLKLENFPPHLLLDTKKRILNEDSVDVDLNTDSVENFIKLRWTVLKDFVLQQCPELHKLQNSSSSTFSKETTREFYVGVYEVKKTTLNVKIGKDLFSFNAIFFNAIIGYDDKSLRDMCFDKLNGLEYSLGYKLTATKLEPEGPSLNGDSK